MSTPSAPEASSGARLHENPEQVLRNESERIAKLLRVRRKATFVIAVVFALATLSAVFLLTRYVRSEEKRIDGISSQLTLANQRLRVQEEWLDRLNKDRALVDSILMQYRVLIARVQDSTSSYSQTLVARADSALRVEISNTETRAGRQSARWDTAWSRGGRTIADSIGVRLSAVEGAAEDFTRRFDTIPARVARHEQGLGEVGAFNDSVRGVLTGFDEDIGLLQRSTRRDSTMLRSIQRNIIELDTAVTTTRNRLEQLERPRVAVPDPAGAPTPLRR